ncbi:response regulator [Rufibacter soli]
MAIFVIVTVSKAPTTMPAIQKQNPNYQETGEILVIDDDSSSLFLIEDLLQSLGMGGKVTTATNAADALALIKSRIGTNKFPELLFLDIKMPGIDGFGFLEQLRHMYHPNHAEPKVVVLSYYGNRVYQEQAAQFGVSAYLRKPLTKEKVMDVMDLHTFNN